MKRIIITTNGLNRHGYRIITEGIDMTAYLKNPVMFYDHDTDDLPCGRMEDIQIDKDGVMTGMPKFDEKDEAAMKLKQKYEDGYINAASIHVRPIATSNAEADLVPGQKCETVTESELLEISLVGIPGNADAVRLSGIESPPIINKISHKKMELKAIALQLGLSETATQDEVAAAIAKMKNAEVEAVLQLGVDKGLINDVNKEQYRQLALSNVEAVKGIVQNHKQDTTPPAAAPAATQPKSLVETMRLGAQTPKPDEGRESWTLKDWQEKDSAGLTAMRKSDATKYESLAQSYYKSVTGFDYNPD